MPKPFLRPIEKSNFPLGRDDSDDDEEDEEDQRSYEEAGGPYKN